MRVLACTLCLACVLLLTIVGRTTFAMNASPGESVANADRYDGQSITTHGTVKNLRETGRASRN
jgi:hypothetical protein